jgi:RNA recognition motif-containing protein
MSDTAAPARLYVGNIPWSTTIDELRDIFAECGGVRDVDIPTGRQGRSRGYGIVEFNTTEEALAAVTRMDGTCGGWCDVMCVRSSGAIAMKRDDGWASAWWLMMA